MEHPNRKRWVGLLLLLLLGAILTPFVLRDTHEVQLSLDMKAPAPPSIQPVRVESRLSREMVARTRHQIQQQRQQLGPEPRVQPHSQPGGKAQDPALLRAWTVRLALFGQQRPAEELASALRDAGYNAYWRRVRPEPETTQYQVYAGPELKRKAARRLKRRIAHDDAFGLKGQLVPYHP